MNHQELINLCESFTEKARTSTTKIDLLTITLAAKAFYQTDWGLPFKDMGNWMSELEKKIRHISECKNTETSDGNELSSFKQDIVEALCRLCGNFTYPPRYNPKN